MEPSDPPPADIEPPEGLRLELALWFGVGSGWVWADVREIDPRLFYEIVYEALLCTVVPPATPCPLCIEFRFRCRRDTNAEKHIERPH